MSSGLDYGMHNVFDLYKLMRPLKPNSHLSKNSYFIQTERHNPKSNQLLHSSMLLSCLDTFWMHPGGWTHLTMHWK